MICIDQPKNLFNLPIRCCWEDPLLCGSDAPSLLKPYCFADQEEFDYWGDEFDYAKEWDERMAPPSESLITRYPF